MRRYAARRTEKWSTNRTSALSIPRPKARTYPSQAQIQKDFFLPTYRCTYDFNISSPPFDMEILLLRVGQIGMVNAGSDFTHGDSLKFFRYRLGILWI